LKKSEPNALRRELARSQRTAPHPDADLLTALEEGMLSKRERDQLVEHLAVCAECRDVRSLAASSAHDPVTDEVAQVLTRPARPPLRTWLPWVATAAGVVIISSAVFLHERKPELSGHLENNSNLVAKTTVPAPVLPDKQLKTPPSEEPKAVHNKPAPHLASKAAPAAPKPVGETAAHADQETTNKPIAPLPNSAPIGGPVVAGISRAPGANRALPAQSALAFSEASQVTSQTESLSHRTARPQWRINAVGQAERSYVAGAWQVVLPDEKMRVVAVFGNEVWIGGENQRLYHSPDNGTTWNSVTLPTKNGVERAIMHIRFQTPQTGTVETEDGNSWTTIDGGKTWK